MGKREKKMLTITLRDSVLYKQRAALLPEPHKAGRVFDNTDSS